MEMVLVDEQRVKLGQYDPVPDIQHFCQCSADIPNTTYSVLIAIVSWLPLWSSSLLKD